MFRGCDLLRLSVDYNEKELTHSYQWFQDDLMTFFERSGDSLSVTTIKKILFKIAQAIEVHHTKDYIHLGRIWRSLKSGFLLVYTNHVLFRLET